MANQLASESSLYLRQHQDNPVNWFPWGEQALERASLENKLILVSIGYSSCHWCHVMERECFEKEEVGELMNAHFISIKVDREERPDIDQVYMLAVQLMTGQGGWPMNVVCLPDGRPIYGGTYFALEDWKRILMQLSQKWEHEPALLVEYAERLTKGIQSSENFPVQPLKKAYTRQDLQEIVNDWRKNFDTHDGGYLREPKFPLPNNWLFLLRYGALLQDQEVLDHAHFTLRKIASGGIYDQVGGGFARYSVDRRWHIPHFEKMLYDNALLVSLYSEAYQQKPDPLYKRIVAETLEWIRREMTTPEGGFYSSLDADSEGVEGKYYSFTKQAFQHALGEDAEIFQAYFNVSAAGNWEEEGTNVLYIDLEADKLAENRGYSETEWAEKLTAAKKKLFDYREQRIRPTLDTKVLLAWNAMLLKAHIDAYRVFGQESYLHVAKRNAEYIQVHLKDTSGNLMRHVVAQGAASPAFLDDYAFYMEALIALYEVTFEEKWIYEAKELAEYVIEHFYEPGASAFYYSSKNSEKLIARKFEIMDDVIPSSNSVLNSQLIKLGLIFDKLEFNELSKQLLANVFPQLKLYGSTFSNWAIQALEEVLGKYEIALTGPDFVDMRKALDQYYIPNKLLMGGLSGSLPLLENRIGDKSKAYVCQHKTCSLPVDTINDLLKLIFKPEY